MKRFVILLLSLAALLCGCGNGEEEAFAEFREKLCEASSLSFTADVQAEYEEKTAAFTLSFTMEDGEYTVEILEPELVKGLKAHVKSGETHLDYDGAILDIGKLTDRGLCPMSALPCLIDAAKDAHTDMAWTEDGLLTVRLVPTDDISVTLWISAEGVPQNAEITYNEKTVLFVTIHNWEISQNERPSEENLG